MRVEEALVQVEQLVVILHQKLHARLVTTRGTHGLAAHTETSKHTHAHTGTHNCTCAQDTDRHAHRHVYPVRNRPGAPLEETVIFSTTRGHVVVNPVGVCVCVCVCVWGGGGGAGGGGGGGVFFLGEG